MEGKILERLKRVMFSILTMALVAGMFVGSGMEARAEEATGIATVSENSPVIEERWIAINFSGSHMNNGNFDSGFTFSLEQEALDAEIIMETVNDSFSETCNIIGVYEDAACTIPVSGTYSEGMSADEPLNVYVVLDCQHISCENIPTISNILLTGASYDSANKKLSATLTFDYVNMDGQWIFDCIVNNSNNYFMWAWHAKGSGTASATLEFAVEDENVPLVIVSGAMYNVEDRENYYPMNMESITIDPKNPTANVVEIPSAPSCDADDDDKDSDDKDSDDERKTAQTPENNYGVFQESIKTSVDTAIAQAAQQAAATGTAADVKPIAIDTGVWISFKGDVYQKLQDSGLPVQITFRYRGVRYRVDIPAGADLMSLVDENGYCGFLNLMAHFGGTVL